MNLLEKYIFLLRDFSSGKISIFEFEKKYLESFKSENEAIPGNIYKVLNDLFLDVDAYCGDEDLRDENDLDDEQLMQSVIKALKKLEAF